ncbi:MAG: 23S rRNA (guanosine(2251)-2'-O)-methyltransferase RlmB [Alphaproteobacteria bacterium]|nr:23S rRNA (guanosine(2251)-2'-O)-methyltransferase RlmB [Alphaproteobacteria bacterium]
MKSKPPKHGTKYGPKKGPKHGQQPRSGPARPPRAIKEAPPARLKIDLFGAHAVAEAWKNPRRFVHSLYITEAARGRFDFNSPAKRPAPTIVTKEQLDKSLPPGTVHQGIALSCQPLEEISVSDLIVRADGKPRSVLVMLDQVTDPHNIGAILRSASAFGAHGMILQRKHAPEPNGILAKTACGALEYVGMAYETNLSRALETLKEAGYTAIGLDEHAPATFGSLPAFDKIVLVLGAEGPGMRRLIREHCDVLVTLPTGGPIASLNVSNAAAVALYALLS